MSELPDGHLPVSPAHRRAGRVVVAALTGVLCLITVAAPALGASSYSVDLYRTDFYAAQVDDRTCTAASVAMMLEMLAFRRVGIPVTDSGAYSRTGTRKVWVESRTGELAILRYEQANDALSGGTGRGSDARGWAIALTEMSRYADDPTNFGHLAFDSPGEALQFAATQMAKLGKPVGILAAAGTHGIVMTGFNATADPSKTSDFTITAIAYSDPYGVHHDVVSPTVFDDAPLFTRYKELDARPWFDGYWYDHWVIVAPMD